MISIKYGFQNFLLKRGFMTSLNIHLKSLICCTFLPFMNHLPLNISSKHQIQTNLNHLTGRAELHLGFDCI